MFSDINGFIPEEILIVTADYPHILSSGYRSPYEHHITTATKVAPTYIVNPANPSSVQRAIYLASQYKATVHKTQATNILTDLKLLDYIRPYGAYATNKQGLFLDIEPDVLHEIITSQSINNRILKGQFTFVQLHNKSLLKLIRIGSKQHEMALRTSQGYNNALIKNKDLQIGGEYVSKSGSRAIFLGKINTVEYFYAWSNRSFKEYPCNNSLLWFKLPYLASEQIELINKNPEKYILKTPIEETVNNINFTKTHSMRDLVKIHPISTNFVSKLREYYRKSFPSVFITLKNSDKSWEKNRIYNFAGVLNLYDSTVELQPEMNEFKKILLLC